MRLKRFAGAMIAVVGCLVFAGSVAAGEIAVGPDMPVGKTIAAAQPGDVIVLPDGVHTDLKIAFAAAGLPGKPITLKAKNPGKCTLTGAAGITISGKHLVVEGLVFDQAWGAGIVMLRGATDCRLTDCAFIECGNPESTFGRAIDLAERSKNNRVDHCYMQGNLSMGMGVKVGEPDNLENSDNTFDHNYFRNIVHRFNNGQESVQLGQGPAGETAVRATVEFCLFERANGDPEIISSKSSSNVLRYNTFRDCDYGSLTLRGGANTRVEGNFFFGCKSAVRMYGKGHQFVGNYVEGCRQGILLAYGDNNHAPITGGLVAFNTVVNCEKGGILIGSRSDPRDAERLEKYSPSDNRIANNIVVGDKSTLLDNAPGKGVTWLQNIVWPQGNAEAGLKDAGIVVEDPRLTQADGLWRLPKSGSPAAGSAAPLPDFTPPDDIFGRPRKGKLDVGCEQAGDGPCLRKPLEPKDVGPSWMKGDPTCIRRIESPKPIPAPAKKPTPAAPKAP
ncbi:MAG: polysaccharide lyase 6 family protein [Planctomycetota bacterium]|nr:polysaccharide lyase 6 family protein [Planctomycetota bacterium]